MRIFLAPLSWLYALIIAIRHMLYDHHILPSHEVTVPTICVGNLVLGGTGKTPHVEYLIKLLTQNGFKLAVLMRGYKRKTTGFIIADEKQSAKTIGDEAMQLYAKFPNTTIAVCENRVKGITLLQKHLDKLDVVLLDDAFQHRALRCGLKILLTTYDNLYKDDHMLPYGSLRDLPDRAQKADVILVTKCPANMQPIDMRVVDNKLALPVFQQLHFTAIQYSDINYQGIPLLVCGIAQPRYVIEYVKTKYPQALVMTFPDHYPYKDSDVNNIVKQAAKVDFVITTEKDMQRLNTTDLSNKLQAINMPLCVLPVSVKFKTDAAVFDKKVITYIRENNRKK